MRRRVKQVLLFAGATLVLAWAMDSCVRTARELSKDVRGADQPEEWRWR